MTNIAIVLPTNIGDTIMAFGVIDRLRSTYPDACITALASPRNEALLRRHLFIDDVVIFDKHWSSKTKIEFVLTHMGHYDMVVDLKNTFLPFLLGARLRTPFIRNLSPLVPMPQQYLALVDKLAKEGDFAKGEIVVSDAEQVKLDELGIKRGSIFVFLAARGMLKQYPNVKSHALVEELSKSYSIVLCGEKADIDYYSPLANMPNVIDLCGKTSIADIFYLLKHYAKGVLTVDTGAIHAASYCDLPIVALFGPTPVTIYGPWSKSFKIVRKQGVKCAPCMKAHCVHNNECMDIDIDLILDGCREKFNG